MSSTESKPDKIVPYAIANEPDGGALFLYGDPNASKISLLCAGFPDDHEIFQPFAKRLAEESFCFVGVMALPGFDDRPEKPWMSHKKDGYTLNEMTNSVREAVKVLRAQSTNKAAEFTGIFHDWGVPPGADFVNRVVEEKNIELTPNKLVYFDVLLDPHKNTKDIPDAPGKTFVEKSLEMVYRTIFASTFLLQRYVSKFLAKVFFIIGAISMAILKLEPTKDIDKKVFENSPKDLNRMMYMMYPYCMFFSDMLDESSMHEDLSSIPMLYMYGEDKNVHFHPNNMLKILEREKSENRSISEAIAVKDAGHYLYVQKEDLCLEAVKAFMKK